MKIHIGLYHDNVNGTSPALTSSAAAWPHSSVDDSLWTLRLRVLSDWASRRHVEIVSLRRCFSNSRSDSLFTRSEDNDDDDDEPPPSVPTSELLLLMEISSVVVVCTALCSVGRPSVTLSSVSRCCTPFCFQTSAV